MVDAFGRAVLRPGRLTPRKLFRADSVARRELWRVPSGVTLFERGYVTRSTDPSNVNAMERRIPAYGQRAHIEAAKGTVTKFRAD